MKLLLQTKLFGSATVRANATLLVCKPSEGNVHF